LLQFPTPMGMLPQMMNIKLARAYVMEQPYQCVVPPGEGFKMGTIFPYLLNTYAYSLMKAEEGGSPWQK
jgi:hypothetical protein